MNKGDKHGRLTAYAAAGSGSSGHILWDFLCDCGGKVRVQQAKVLAGHTKSCGCLQKEKASARLLKHGHNKKRQPTRTYRIWQNMWTRCTNPDVPSFKYYGAEGVKVCDRWRKFENFLFDMGEAPQDLSIDRIDNTLGYFKENCRWATRQTQGENRRSVRWYEWNGERLTAAGWARKIGINNSTMYERLEKWPLERALTEKKN